VNPECAVDAFGESGGQKTLEPRETPGLALPHSTPPAPVTQRSAMRTTAGPHRCEVIRSPAAPVGQSLGPGSPKAVTTANAEACISTALSMQRRQELTLSAASPRNPNWAGKAYVSGWAETISRFDAHTRDRRMCGRRAGHVRFEARISRPNAS
jgi:hypothetical protein